MGGLILRAAVNRPDCPSEARTGQAILIAPPNRGSAFGRKIARYALVRWIVGKHAGYQLTTSDDFDRLGTFPPTMGVLVIAGDADSKVKPAETRLATPHTFHLVATGHTFAMRSSDVIDLTCNFLRPASDLRVDAIYAP